MQGQERENNGRREKKEKEERRSKDKKINAEEKIFLNKIEKVGWAIWNRDVVGNKEKKWMFRKVRRVCKIDYVKREARNKEWIERLKTADSIDSNHYSVVVWVKDRKRKKRKKWKESKD